MKTLKIVSVILCMCIVSFAFGQRERVDSGQVKVEQLLRDPDWQLIYDNNMDFLNRLLPLPNTLSDIWSMGQDHFLEQLGYSGDEYYRKHIETKQAAIRLLEKYPVMKTMGCENCELSDWTLIGRVDNFISAMRSQNVIDVRSGLRAIDEEAVVEGPKCSLAFYACVLVCASTIEIFPIYLACSAVCMCKHCKNPPKWLCG